MRQPGIEPGSIAWKATMLTFTPPTLSCLRVSVIENLNGKPRFDNFLESTQKQNPIKIWFVVIFSSLVILNLNRFNSTWAAVV